MRAITQQEVNSISGGWLRYPSGPLGPIPVRPWVEKLIDWWL